VISSAVVHLPQLEEKMTGLQEELEKARQELANQQSERQRIMCDRFFTHD
jgi:hypothetical protein